MSDCGHQYRDGATCVECYLAALRATVATLRAALETVTHELMDQHGWLNFDGRLCICHCLDDDHPNNNVDWHDKGEDFIVPETHDEFCDKFAKAHQMGRAALASTTKPGETGP
jgi:hypothetical protein